MRVGAGKKKKKEKKTTYVRAGNQQRLFPDVVLLSLSDERVRAGGDTVHLTIFTDVHGLFSFLLLLLLIIVLFKRRSDRDVSAPVFRKNIFCFRSHKPKPTKNCSRTETKSVCECVCGLWTPCG